MIRRHLELSVPSVSKMAAQDGSMLRNWYRLMRHSLSSSEFAPTALSRLLALEQPMSHSPPPSQIKGVGLTFESLFRTILEQTTTFGASPPSCKTAKYSGYYYSPDKPSSILRSATIATKINGNFVKGKKSYRRRLSTRCQAFYAIVSTEGCGPSGTHRPTDYRRTSECPPRTSSCWPHCGSAARV